jgi:hypothetical protein
MFGQFGVLRPPPWSVEGPFAGAVGVGFVVLDCAYA